MRHSTCCFEPTFSFSSQALACDELVTLRDGVLLLSLASDALIVPNATVFSWMASCYLCQVYHVLPYDQIVAIAIQTFAYFTQELSSALSDFGIALKDIRAKEVPIGE